MTDSEAADAPRFAARIVESDLVPEGRTLVQIDLPGETIIAVKPGHMSSQLMAEWNRALRHATETGRWPQIENDPDEKPDDEKPGEQPPA